MTKQVQHQRQPLLRAFEQVLEEQKTMMKMRFVVVALLAVVVVSVPRSS